MPRFVTAAARRHPVIVVLAWLMIAGAGIAVGNGVFARLTTTVGTVPASGSARGAAELSRAGLSQPVLTAVISGRSPADRALRAEVLAAVRDVRIIPGVAGVAGPFAHGAPVPVTGRAVLLTIRLRPGQAGPAASAVVRRLRSIDAPHVAVAGGPLTDGEFTSQAAADTHRAELIALPLLAVLLLLVFGSLAAAALPLLIAVAGVCTTLGLLFGFSHVTGVSVYAIPVTTMLSVGLAVDYSLLMVKRYQEERARAADPAAALESACASAGRTVLFSGLTVSVSMAGLLVFPDPFLRSLGIAGASVVVIDMLAALTLLPALLVLTGHRIRAARQRAGRGVLAGVVALVQRRPLVVLAITAGLLVTVMLPVFGMRLTTGDPRSLPASSQTRQLYEALQEHFPALAGPAPITIVAATSPGRGLTTYRGQVARVAGVAAVEAGGSAGGLTVLEAVPAHPVDSAPTARTVAELRGLRSGFPVTVTGDAARLADYRASVRQRAPWAIGLVALATFVLLFLFTGSLLLPAQAVITNVAGLSAGLGAVVWIFQDGHFSALLSTPTLGAVDLTVPVVVAAIAFGLATDYQVFLLARVREQWLSGARPGRAVAAGVRSSGPIILAAALLLVTAFAGFLAGGFAPVKEVGVGLVVAVTTDVVLVRMLLVPALLTRLGAISWWAPGFLRRLHRRFGIAAEKTSPAEPATAHPDARVGS